jgi:hypothetical protein
MQCPDLSAGKRGVGMGRGLTPIGPNSNPSVRVCFIRREAKQDGHTFKRT